MSTPTPHRARKAPLAHDPEALRAARARLGITQRRVADLIGVSVSAISEAESGSRGLSLPRLQAVADILSVPYDTLLSGHPDAVIRQRVNGAPPPAPAEELCQLCLKPGRRVVTTVPISACDVPACAPCARARKRRNP
jgi:DNA-binding XRE family transcriptional regulator